MKGIVLAGGSGSRLFPVTQGCCKQLLPVFDKPMIYYPLSTLMLAGIKEILLIVNAEDEAGFRRLLGDGSQLGIAICYAVQAAPEGIAQALILAADFLAGKSCALILGDNIFYGQGMGRHLERLVARQLNIGGATVLSYRVSDPHRFGVFEFATDGRVISLEEKPSVPASNWVQTGLYLFDNDAVKFAQQLSPSARGELEIVDVVKQYLAEQRLFVEKLGRGVAWLDTGTLASMMQASAFVESIQSVQGLKIASPEEIAWRKGWITTTMLLQQAHAMGNSEYGQYLADIGQERND